MRVLLLALALLVAGCTYYVAPGGPASFDRSWDAATGALRDQGLDIVSADRSTGAVLMSLGPAEIGQHPIAHELRDVTVEARNLTSHRVLVAPQDPARFFRIATRRQRRRPDEIDE